MSTLRRSTLIVCCLFALTLFGGCPEPAPRRTTTAAALKHFQGEKNEVHLAEIRQLTFSGENAEAYFSFAGKRLIFQSTHGAYKCDQIFTVGLEAGDKPKLVSTGKGRTTCAYYLPGDKKIVYASTHLAGDACPPTPDRSQGYVWPIYPSYDIFSADADGKNIKPLTKTPGYDAEATVCRKDGSILFTSLRDGDLELYRMDKDGKNVKRLTFTPGYDGGGFFSDDCKQIVWRASRPKGKTLDDYKRLLKKGLIRPGKLEIWVAKANGSDARQITYFNAASFAPFFYPSGDRVIFSSNVGDPRGREFDMWAINVDGTELERITYSKGFDGFPMFSPDGRFLAFGSNRRQKKRGDTNVFLARWDAGRRGAIKKTSVDRVVSDIEWLADEKRGGRDVGTPGLEASLVFVEERFSALGLERGMDGGKSYRHEIDVPMALTIGKETALKIDGAAVPRSAFTPLGFSASGKVKAKVVAVGYAMVDQKAKLDDFKGKRLKGKIALARRFVPKGQIFSSKRKKRRAESLREKALRARQAGAAALVVVDSPQPIKTKKGDAPKIPKDAPLPIPEAEIYGDVGIPVIVLKRAAGEKLFSGRHEIELEVAISPKKKKSANLVAVLRAGASPKKAEPLLIGAHVDHLGHGGRSSRAPGKKAVHPGADDNASGVAVMLEIARALAKQKDNLQRDVYFVAFTAEERGALGSYAFVKRPPAGLLPKDLMAMIDLDMVGRMRQNRLVAIGTKTAEQWPRIVTDACDAARVECSLGGSGIGPSDHTAFFLAGVPVIHFFTGSHAQYHRPEDKAELINGAGAAQVAKIVTSITLALSKRDAKMTYHAAPPPLPDGDARTRGASLGSIPDYTGPSHGRPGVLLAGVVPGGPAKKAGLARNDVLIKLADQDVRNAHDLAYILRNARPGQKTTAVVVRGEKTLTFEVILGKSRRRRGGRHYKK